MILSKISNIIPLNILNLFTKIIEQNPKLALKFLTIADSETIEEISKRKAVKQAKKAFKRVKNYKKFLKSKDFNNKIKNFKDFNKLPFTSKENYIKACKDIKDLLIDSDLSFATTVYKSSGTTGKSFIWAHNYKEGKEGINLSRIGLENLFKISNENALFVNGFALGPWVSGMKFAFIMNSIGPTINPGADYAEILGIIKTLRDKFSQIIIGGYPPFVKNLLEKGILEGINFKDYNLNFLLAGEGFSESFRDYLYTLIKSSPANAKSKIYSVYGAADIGVCGINENKDTVEIRRLAEKNKKLKQKLFRNKKSKLIPMLFQYNPLNFFIEESKGEVIITTINLDKMLPVIRYNIHDSGGVISYKKIKEIFKQQNIDIKVKLKLPFLYIDGRTGGVISINSAKVYPETISKALYQDKSLANLITGKFKLKKQQTSKQQTMFIIEIELKENIKPNIQLKNDFEKLIKKELCETNVEYKDMITHYSKHALPNVNLIEFKKSDSKMIIKHKYI
ncbi:MAG: hypothetical protein KJ646_04505 [Nanoarchaeota archaeon]|nr:hypothetical protein [Nanoarchaeota archaeon]